MKSCVSNTQNQINNGQLALEFVTVNCPNAGSAGLVDRDILVKFQLSHRFFMVASIDHTFVAANIFMHFSQLNYSPVGPGNAITPTGGEPWIPLANQLSGTGKVEGRWIRFKKPIQQFYIDADHQAGVQVGGYKITFIGTDDIEAVIAQRT